MNLIYEMIKWEKRIKKKKINKFDIIFLFRDIFFFGWINMVIIENLYNKVNNLLKKIY